MITYDIPLDLELSDLCTIADLIDLPGELIEFNERQRVHTSITASLTTGVSYWVKLTHVKDIPNAIIQFLTEGDEGTHWVLIYYGKGKLSKLKKTQYRKLCDRHNITNLYIDGSKSSIRNVEAVIGCLAE